mmetsp:Transcript_7023/g.21455  ORF Transcript_7023/g.21455 Transcript_7023/m.21455 type:complete len:218 (+) Transcript_7023:614-1267(+)
MLRSRSQTPLSPSARPSPRPRHSSASRRLRTSVTSLRSSPSPSSPPLRPTLSEVTSTRAGQPRSLAKPSNSATTGTSSPRARFGLSARTPLVPPNPPLPAAAHASSWMTRCHPRWTNASLASPRTPSSRASSGAAAKVPSATNPSATSSSRSSMPPSPISRSTEAEASSSQLLGASATPPFSWPLPASWSPSSLAKSPAPLTLYRPSTPFLPGVADG